RGGPCGAAHGARYKFLYVIKGRPLRGRRGPPVGRTAPVFAPPSARRTARRHFTRSPVDEPGRRRRVRLRRRRYVCEMTYADDHQEHEADGRAPLALLLAVPSTGLA
ncbi:hypothetical protein, partial [Streptomyces sp. NPDC093223]|uniref:hypothetical protein n=1 Tax=Streptomyces sp. NPDC093223 TaxID=3366033 RepID=UPI00382C745C